MREAVPMGRFVVQTLRCPIVAAPMAGGPSTPALAAAVSTAGGLGFLAAGYKSAAAVAAEVEVLRSLLDGEVPFGVNVFSPSPGAAARASVTSYAQTLSAEARRLGVALGSARWEDDEYAAKVDLLCLLRIPVVSFTFGCPTRGDVDRLHAAATAVWVTVTTVEEARSAQQAGADALVVQGVEAGGHRGGFDDSRPGDVGLVALLQLVGAALDDALPLIASGGLSTGRGVAAALAAGAVAAQVGTGFLRADEAGTDPAHRELIAKDDRPTALTRAFTGRTARGISNRFLADHTEHAPSAYPEVHHLTAPLRTAARAAGDTEGFPLWAGQAYPLARSGPAAEIVHRLTADAATALRQAHRRTEGSTT